MKLQELITDSFFTDYGIFKEIQSKNIFEWLSQQDSIDLDVDYYLGHSGKKTLSGLCENLIKLESGEKIVSWKSQLASIIILNFKDKWNRLYEAYIDSNYDPIENYSMEEIETPNLTTTETPNLTAETKTKTDLKTEINATADSNTYGFNSPASVPTANSETGSTTEVTGEADDNVETRTESGNKTTTNTGTRTLTRHGNIGVTTSQQMIESELQLRKFKFYEALMNDVDSIMCLKIYD